MSIPLVDTDVLIDALRGVPQAIDWLNQHAALQPGLLSSTITRAELLSGMRPGEEEAMGAMLCGLDWVPVSALIADQAAAYRRFFRHSHGLGLPDALIGATAKLCGARLITLNRKHFPMDDIEVEVPYTK